MQSFEKRAHTQPKEQRCRRALFGDNASGRKEDHLELVERALEARTLELLKVLAGDVLQMLDHIVDAQGLQILWELAGQEHQQTQCA